MKGATGEDMISAAFEGATIVSVVLPVDSVHVAISPAGAADANVLEPLTAVATALTRGNSVTAVVVGRNGRNRVGDLLVRRELLHDALVEAGVEETLARSVPMRWLQPSSDMSIQRWATKLGIDL
jgi:hypothetical protein